MKTLWQDNREFSSKLSGADNRQRVSTTIQMGSKGGCKHSELISYKVHKDQFKSLLVPAQKTYFASKLQAKTGKVADQQRKGKGSGVSDANTSKVYSDNHTVASDAELDSAYLNNASDDSEDEMRSTDGEESDPHSPLVADS